LCKVDADTVCIMASDSPSPKSTFQTKHEQIDRYIELFAEAFDELHRAVVTRANDRKHHLSNHHDYPTMSSSSGGFPMFSETGFFRDTAPKNYTDLVRPRGLGMIVSQTEPVQLPKGAELASFLRNHEIGKKLELNVPIYENKLWDWPIDNLVAHAVERYLHLYGVDAQIDFKRRDEVILPLVLGTIFQTLDLTLVVPITLTHIEVSRFRLSNNAFIAKIPRKLQLGRARINPIGSGAVKTVVGAATHAFVSKGWQLSVDDVNEVPRSLGEASPNVLDAIDSFFGALRVATGISTGYAQILWVPRRWTLQYFCDLTPVYGTTIRRYPNEFDNFGWNNQRDTITVEQLKETRRIYQAVVASQSEGVRLALNRLNACLTRSDAADAILDGTIGLELLLGDDDNQSLSYKLRLRAAALALLRANPAYPASEVVSKVKRLYTARSKIVHGRRKKRSNKASEPMDASNSEERALASNLLRFVLDALLTHPEYLDPLKIDDGLLLRADNVAVPTADAKPRRRKRKVDVTPDPSSSETSP
jgi:hypothetical protein